MGIPEATLLLSNYQHTHTHTQAEPKYYLSIFIIRNPYDALVSEWNRWMSTKQINGSKDSEHTRLAGPEAFGELILWCSYILSIDAGVLLVWLARPPTSTLLAATLYWKQYK